MRSEEEIRAELRQAHALRAHSESYTHKQNLRGIVAEEIVDKLDQRIRALEWVLNDKGEKSTSKEIKPGEMRK